MKYQSNTISRLIIQSLILFYCLLNIIYCASCDALCKSCNSITQKCDACVDNFILNSLTDSCQSSCLFGQVLNIDTNYCVSICPEGYFSNPLNLACEKLKQCPILHEYGQELFDSFSQIIVTKQYLIIRGVLKNQASQDLKILDIKNYQYVGQMSQHQYGVIQMIMIKSTKDNIINEKLISISKKEIVLWDINLGMQTGIGLFSDDVIGVENVSLLNEQYLILIYNDTNFLQFALVDIQKFIQDINNPLSQISQSGLSIINNIQYQLFYKVHTQPLLGFFIVSDFIYSYSKDGQIIEWQISSKQMTKRISTNNFQFSFINYDYSSQIFIHNSNNPLNFRKCSRLQCDEIQTTHTSQIEKVIIYKNQILQESLLLTFSKQEFMAYMINSDSTIEYSQTIQSQSNYRFISNNFISIIQEDGSFVLYEISISDFSQIKMIGQQQKRTLRYQTTTDFVMVSKQDKNDFILMNNGITVFSNSITDTSIINRIDSKRMLSSNYRTHIGDVNGILIDSFYNRVITYGQDGSFRIWDPQDITKSDFRLLLVQFHPNCPLYLEGACKVEITNMKIIRSDLLLTQYSDNLLCIWTYTQYNIVLKLKFNLDRTDLPILNTQFYKNQYFVFCNQSQVKIFNILTFAMDTNAYGNYRYCFLDYKTKFELIIVDPVKSKAIYCNFPAGTQTGKAAAITAGTIINLQFYDMISTLIIGYKSNTMIVMYTQAVQFRTVYVNSPNFVSINPVSSAQNMYVFSQNYTISYYNYVIIPPATVGSNMLQNQYLFSASVEKAPISFANPEMHFFFQNTVVPQVQNQVFCLGANFQVMFLFTFEDKISSISVDINNYIVYISFTSGKFFSRYFQLPSFYYEDNITYKQIIYSSLLKKTFAVSDQIQEINTIEWKKGNVYQGVHPGGTNGIILDELNKYIISYSLDTSQNLARWNLQTQQYNVFLNGHTQSVRNVYLDTINDILISFADDFYLIVWKYSDQSIIYKIDSHLSDKIILDQSQQDILPELRRPFSVKMIEVDQQNGRIFSLNSESKMYCHYYLQQTMKSINVGTPLQLYIDKEQGYEGILVVETNNFQQTSESTDVFSSSLQIIKKYDYFSFKLIYSTAYHTSTITGIQFKLDKAYSYESTVIAVMERKTLTLINYILCSNPVISSFIISPRLNTIFIYSDAQADILNSRIAVYRISGEKISEIISAQGIEMGNISKVILDEEAYQLIVFRQTIFYAYTVDIRTFRYSSYLPIIYDNIISDVIILPDSNAILFRDSSSLKVYPYQMSLNLNNNMKDISQPSQLDYFVNQDTQQIFLIDCENVAWQYDPFNNNSLVELYEFDVVQSTQYKNGYFFVFTISEIKIFDKSFNSVIDIEHSVMITQFTDKYLFFTTNDNLILNIDLTTFQLGKLNQSILINANKIIINEEFNEIMILQSSQKVYIIDYETNIIKNQVTAVGVTQLFYDQQKHIILQIQSDSLIAYQQYQKSTIDYTTNSSQLFTDIIGVKDILIDNVKNTIYVYYVNNKIPLVKVLNYKVNIITNFLEPFIVKGILPVPTNDPSTQILIIQNLFLIRSYYQILIYDQDTLNLVQSMRDNNIFQSSKKISLFNNAQGLSFQQSTNELSLFQSAGQSITKLQSFNLILPEIINFTQQSILNYLNINIDGISSGKIFKYLFNLQLQQGQNQNQFGIDDQKCFLKLPSFTSHFQFKSYLQNVISSFGQLNVNKNTLLLQMNDFYLINSNFMNQKQVNIDGLAYYDSLLKNMNATLLYTQSERKKIQIKSDFFVQNNLKIIEFQNFEFDLSLLTSSVIFSSTTEVVIFRDIIFNTNANGISFYFQSLKRVILENITFKNAEITSSQLFNFININEIFIKDILFQNVKISQYSSIFTIRETTTIQFHNITFNSIEAIQSRRNLILEGQNSFSIVDSTLIYIENVQTAKYEILKFNNLVSSYQNKIILSLGVITTEISNVYQNDCLSYELLRWESQYDKKDKQYILEYTKITINDVHINNVKNLENNLIYLQGAEVNILQSTFTQIVCLTCEGAVLKLQSISSLLIQSSEFTFNSGRSGAGLALFNCKPSNSTNTMQQIVIKSSVFEQNTVTESGGALYLYNSDLDMLDTSVSYNSALIGGGIRYLIIYPTFLAKEQLYQSTKDEKYNNKNKILQNKADIHSKDIGSHISHITVSSSEYLEMDELDQQSPSQTIYELSKAHVLNFRSGATIDLKIQLVDDNGIPAFFDVSQYKNGYYPQNIKNEIDQYQIKASIPDNTIKLFGQQTTDFINYNQNERSFYIKGMMIIANPESQNFLTLLSPSIIKPTYDSFTKQSYVFDSKFYMKILVNFRQCQPGEIFRMSGSLFFCQECLEGTYSLIQPSKDKYSTESCQKCPEEASNCFRNMMSLKDGYWKSTNSSSNIIECDNKKINCNGDWNKGYCLEGHIGPLCEMCDIDGKVWGKQYASDGSFNCLSCSIVTTVKFVLPTLLLLIGMIFYIILSIKIALQVSKQIVMGYYLRMMQIIPVSKSSFSDTTNMNIKQLINYMQLSQLVNTVQVELPTFVTFFPTYVGSPLQNMKYTLDCWLIQFQYKDIPIVYSRTLWTLVIPLLYLIGVTLIYLFFIVIRYTKLTRSSIQSGLVFLFFFIQPNMISNLLQVMSCRQIDSKMYIQADISFECYTKEHLKFLGFICFPGFILWGILIPYFILKSLIKSKDKLEYSQVRLRYGFLYQDYKLKSYYWEFVRINLKIVIIIIMNFYGDPYTNKLVIALVAIIIYMVIQQKKKPFQMEYFQEIDKKSMVVIITLILMNIFIYNEPPYGQQVLFYIILLGIHNGYMAYLFWEVVKAKIQISYKSQYSFILKKLIQWFPVLNQYLELPKTISFKTFKSWKKLQVILTNERKQLSEQVKDQIFGLSSFSNREHRKVQSSLNPNFSSQSNNNVKDSKTSTMIGQKPSSLGQNDNYQSQNTRIHQSLTFAQVEQLSLIERSNGISDSFHSQIMANLAFAQHQTDKKQGAVFRNLKKVSIESDRLHYYGDQNRYSREIVQSHFLRKELTMHIEEEDSEKTSNQGYSNQNIRSLQSIAEDFLPSPPRCQQVKAFSNNNKNKNNNNNSPSNDIIQFTPDSIVSVPSQLSTINLSSKASRLSMHFNEDNMRKKKASDSNIKGGYYLDQSNSKIESKNSLSYGNDERQIQNSRIKSLSQTRQSSIKKSPNHTTQIIPHDDKIVDIQDQIQQRQREFNSSQNDNDNKINSSYHSNNLSQQMKQSKSNSQSYSVRKFQNQFQPQSISVIEEASLSSSIRDDLSSEDREDGQLDSPPARFNNRLFPFSIQKSLEQQNQIQDNSNSNHDQQQSSSARNKSERQSSYHMEKQTSPFKIDLKILSQSNSIHDDDDQDHQNSKNYDSQGNEDVNRKQTFDDSVYSVSYDNNSDIRQYNPIKYGQRPQQKRMEELVQNNSQEQETKHNPHEQIQIKQSLTVNYNHDESNFDNYLQDSHDKSHNVKIIKKLATLNSIVKQIQDTMKETH